MWLALLACAGLAQEPAQDPATGTVVGRIENVNGDHAQGDWVVDLSGDNRKTIQVERKNGEFRFEDVEPGTLRLYACSTDMPLWAENPAIEVEAGKETYVVLRDDSRWVEVQLIERRSPLADQYFESTAVTLLGSDGYEETAHYLYQEDSTFLFEGVGQPPFRLRLEGEGIQPVDVEGVALCAQVELDVRGTGTVVFEAQDETSEFLLDGAEFYLSYYGVPDVHAHPYWWSLAEPTLNVPPGHYSALLRLWDGQVFQFTLFEVVAGVPKVLPVGLGECAPLLLDLRAGDERTGVWIDGVTYPDHLKGSGLIVPELQKLQPDLWRLEAHGVRVEMGSFPYGTQLQIIVRRGPWFLEEFAVTIDGSVKTFEPGPMAFVEVEYERDGDPLAPVVPAMRISLPGSVRQSMARWDELRRREPIHPGRVAAGLARAGSMMFLPGIEVREGEVARFETIRVSEWLPTSCPVTVVVDGEVVRAGFAISPADSFYTLGHQPRLAVKPGEVEILLYDLGGSWLLRPEKFELKPGDERPLKFRVTRTSRRVRFFDWDGEPVALRRVAIKRPHPDYEGHDLTGRVKTDEDGYAEVRLTPGTLTFSRLGREVTVDWPIETDTLTLK